VSSFTSTALPVIKGSKEEVCNKFYDLNSSPAKQQDSLSQGLRRAIENFKERMLSGLNGLTSEDIEEKIEEFIQLWKPENATEEEMAAFEAKLADFKEVLYKIATGEMLISSAGVAQNEAQTIAGFKRAKIMAGSPMIQKDTIVSHSAIASRE